MASIMEAVDVDVPVSTAYNQWTQFESFPAFLDFVESVEQLDETSLQWHVRIAGVEREFITVITEQHPDERVAWKSVGGDVDHAGVVTFHRLDDAHSRVSVQLEWEPADAAEKVGNALGIDQFAVHRDLEHFKEFMESRGAETGAWRGDVG